MLVITVMLLGVLSTGAQNTNNYNPKGWQAANEFLSEFMDPSINPCTNFTGFMCGKFGNASNPEYYTWDNEQKKRHVRIMINAITAIDLNDTKTPKYARLVRNFYDQCIQVQMDSGYYIKVIYDVVSPILGPHPAFVNSTSTDESWDDIWYLMGKLQSEFGDDIALKSPEATIKSSDGITRHGYLDLSPKDNTSHEYNPDQSKSRIFWLSYLSKINVDMKHLNETIADAGEFWRNWQNAFKIQVNWNKNDTAEFGNFTTVPNIDWSSYWRGLLTNDLINGWLNVPIPGKRPILYGLELVQAIADAFNKAPLRAVKTVLYDYYMYLAEVKTPGLKFSDQQCWIYNFDPETVCVEYVLQQATPAAVRVYFDHIGEDLLTWRNDFLMIGNNIFSAMSLLLNSIDYMSPKSKEAVNRKMDNIWINPGIPTWIMDHDKVMANSIGYNKKQSFFANVMRRSGEMFKEEMRSMLLDPENAESDPGPTMVVNSNFSPLKNNMHINVFLGYNLPPFFSQFYPLSLKYALTGFLLGHELMHAFDPGRIRSEGYEKMLTEDELESYNRSARCLIKQYSRACYKQLGVCQMGSVAIEDNVADIGGLKAAFAAYQFHKDLLGEEPLVEGLTGYTHDQLFYMAFQRSYCARNEPTEFWTDANHSPSTTRAKVAMRNSPHFAKAFECPVGSKEAPVNPCKMWGDLNV